MTAPARGEPVHLDPPGPRARRPRPLRRVRRALRARDARPRARSSSRPSSAPRGRPTSSAPSSPSCSRSYAGRPTPVTECHRLSERLGVRVLLEARGPHPHRLAQDQQRARPGAAHPAHGQAARHRRDRRRPARRRHRDRGRAVRPRLRRVHGRGRRRAPGAQRVPHEAPRRRGRARHRRAARRSRTRSTKRCATGSRRVESTHYCIGSVVGPHPYPWMVREFQRVVGDEAREQCRAILGGDDPDLVVACVGGGSNAIGHLRRLPRHRRASSSASRPAGSGSSRASTARR